MSRCLTICGKGQEVTVRFSQPLDCSHTTHELALTDLQMTNTIINVREGCNSMIYYEGEESYVLIVPQGTYNVDMIHEYIYNILSQQFPKEFESGNHYFHLKANTSTHRCSISTSFKIYFGAKEDANAPTLGTTLGFNNKPIEKTEKNAYTHADGTFSLLDDFQVFVTCNVVESGYINSRVSHNVYQFYIDVQPGVIVEEKASHLVFYRVTHRCIDDVTLRLENERGGLIALKDDTKVCFNLVLRERHHGEA